MFESLVPKHCSQKHLRSRIISLDAGLFGEALPMQELAEMILDRPGKSDLCAGQRVSDPNRSCGLLSKA